MKLSSLLMFAFFGAASSQLRPSFDGLPTTPGDGRATRLPPSGPAIRTRRKRDETRRELGIRRRHVGLGYLYWASILSIYVFGNKKIFFLTAAERRIYVAMRRNGWFDEPWYIDTYPDVATSAIDPLHHMIRHGIYEGRLPRHDFSAGRRGLDDDDLVAVARDMYLEMIAALPKRELQPLDLPRVVQGLDKGHLHRFSDATVQRALTRFARFPLFRDADYFSHNEPLRNAPGLVAHRHALTYGFSEGRSVFSKLTIANELGLRSRVSVVSPAVTQEQPCDSKLSISVAYNAAGNSFLKEIAECLVADLQAVDHDVVLLRDRDDPEEARPHNIIVAPHEFFFIGRGPAWVRDDIIRRSVLYNTEQPQTIWFDRAVPFNMLARGVIELAPQLASIYADCLPALFCDPVGPKVEARPPPPSDAILRVLPAPAKRGGERDSDVDDRAIDVSFFGGISAHRERFFASTARFFSDYQTLFYCRRDGTPLVEGEHMSLLKTARHVGFHSKIVLNIHREEFGFFEWHRIVRLGIETGAVIVSEPCLPHPELKPNEHYFEESGRHIQNLVEWLLRSPDGRKEHARVRANARGMIEHRRASNDAGQKITRFLSELG